MSARRVPTAVLSIEYPRTFLIKSSQGSEFHVNPYLMCDVSKRFRDYFLEEHLTEVTVTDRLPVDCFPLFLDLAHGQHVNISTETGPKILRLSDQWEAPSIKEVVETFLQKQHDSEHLVSEIEDQPDMVATLTPDQLLTVLRDPHSPNLEVPVLMSILAASQAAQIDPLLRNQFLLERLSTNRAFPAESIEFLDFPSLTDRQMAQLRSDSRTMNDERVRPKQVFGRDFAVSAPVSKNVKMVPPYYGIFARIGYNDDGDPVASGSVRVTASSHDPQLFVSPARGNTDFMISGEKPSITFRLQKRVSITGYQLTNGFKAMSREWAVYGWNPGGAWTLIHAVDEPDVALDPYASSLERLDEKSPPFVRFRLRSNQKFEGKQKSIAIRHFEVFDDNEFDHPVLAGNSSVLVTTSKNNLQKLVNPRDKKMWFSANAPGQWVKFEFTRHKVIPSGYTIRSGEYWFLKSWLFEGSADGKTWFLIDRCINSDRISRPFKAFHWKCRCMQHCRFLRLTQLGQTTDHLATLCLSGFEVFGSVTEISKTQTEVPDVPDKPAKPPSRDKGQSLPPASSESEAPAPSKARKPFGVTQKLPQAVIIKPQLTTQKPRSSGSDAAAPSPRRPPGDQSAPKVSAPPSTGDSAKSAKPIARTSPNPLGSGSGGKSSAPPDSERPVAAPPALKPVPPASKAESVGPSKPASPPPESGGVADVSAPAVSDRIPPLTLPTHSPPPVESAPSAPSGRSMANPPAVPPEDGSEIPPIPDIGRFTFGSESAGSTTDSTAPPSGPAPEPSTSRDGIATGDTVSVGDENVVTLDDDFDDVEVPVDDVDVPADDVEVTADDEIVVTADDDDGPPDTADVDVIETIDSDGDF
jgi:hypothetical protein